MAVSRALFRLHHETRIGEMKYDSPRDNDPNHTIIEVEWIEIQTYVNDWKWDQILSKYEI